MSAQQSGSPAMVQTGDVVPLPISVWSMIFRFAASTSYFSELERSPFNPAVFDEAGRQLEHDQELLDAFDEHKDTLISLSCVCKAWSHALRHFRLEWVFVGNMDRLSELIRLPSPHHFLPIRRLDLSLRLLSNGHPVEEVGSNICRLVSYCTRLEVLAMDAHFPDAEPASGTYHRRLVRTLANHRNLRKYEVNLGVPDAEDIIFLLKSTPSLETLDIAVVKGTEDRVLTAGSSPCLTAMRLSFEEPATLLLRTLRRHTLSVLDYLWLADYVDPETDESHPALAEAIHAFLRTHGYNLRSMVLVTNAYSLTIDRWFVILAACPSLSEVAIPLPVDPAFVYARPTTGLPHRALSTITINDFNSWSEDVSAASLESETMHFIRSLVSNDFPALRCVRLDVSARNGRARGVHHGFVTLMRALLDACAVRKVRLEDREGETLHINSFRAGF